MKEVKILLDEIDKVKNFVKTVSNFNSDIDLVGGHYIIDAKSILGIFSLDLAEPLILQIEDDDEADAILDAIRDVIVEDEDGK